MRLCSSAAVAFLAVFSTSSDAFPQQLSMKECSSRFEAARETGKSDIPRWSEYRKSECGIDSAAVAEQTAQVAAKNSAPAPIVPQDVKFPAEIDEKFASETPAKQRMKTCLEAYHANKAANTIGELRWIQKGGGYYSLCSARLKESNP